MQEYSQRLSHIYDSHYPGMLTDATHSNDHFVLRIAMSDDVPCSPSSEKERRGPWSEKADPEMSIGNLNLDAESESMTR